MKAMLIILIILLTIIILFYFLINQTPENKIRFLIKINVPPFDSNNVSPRTIEGLKHLNNPKYFTPAQYEFIKILTQKPKPKKVIIENIPVFNDTKILCRMPQIGYSYTFTRNYNIVLNKKPFYFNARVDSFDNGLAIYFVSSSLNISNCTPYNISSTKAYCVPCKDYVFSKVCPNEKPYNCLDCINNSLQQSLNYFACKGDGFGISWVKLNNTYVGLMIKGNPRKLPILFNTLYHIIQEIH